MRNEAIRVCSYSNRGSSEDFRMLLVLLLHWSGPQPLRLPLLAKASETAMAAVRGCRIRAEINCRWLGEDLLLDYYTTFRHNINFRHKTTRVTFTSTSSVHYCRTASSDRTSMRYSKQLSLLVGSFSSSIVNVPCYRSFGFSTCVLSICISLSECLPVSPSPQPIICYGYKLFGRNVCTNKFSLNNTSMNGCINDRHVNCGLYSTKTFALLYQMRSVPLTIV